MAGFDDYQFYTNFKKQDSPFWQKSDKQFDEMDGEIDREIDRSSYGHHFPKSTSYSSGLSQSTYVKPDKIYKNETDNQLEKFGELPFTLISLCTENILSHPFVILRRQCQANSSSQRYHLQPFTLMPVMYQIQSHQGFSALWKGLGSVLTLKGVTLAVEDCISKFTPWPKEITPDSSLRMLGRHFMLKSASLAIVTPFFSASLVETVQSEITSERPGVLDVFKEGFYRLVSFTQPQTGRLLPVWQLLVPTVAYGLLQYIISSIVSTLSSVAIKKIRMRKEKKQGAHSKDTWKDVTLRLQSAYFGHLVSNVVLYPLETILHRLHLQGTTTIIDSLDVGNEVKPVLTRYEGFFDCFNTTVREEGFSGLFKGFGALCLQFFVYGAVLKFAYVIINEFSFVISTTEPQQKLDTMAPLAPGVTYNPIKMNSASLHSSPVHAGRRLNPRDGWMHSGSVDLSDYSSQPPEELREKVYQYRDELQNI